MTARHAPWLVVVAAALAVALVPRLRDQARFQWVTLPRHVGRVPHPGEDPPRLDPIMDWANSYRLRCAEFAQTRYPNDAEMLMAAGMLTPDRAAGMKLLERAAELAPGPVTLSAYVDGVLDRGPYYETPGTLGVDPMQRGEVAAARRGIARNRTPSSLSRREAAPLLSALARWWRADPRNALPLAVEVWCLYGMGERDEAVARWTQAAGLPEVDAHVSERWAAIRTLLIRMGLPAPEAVIAAKAALTSPSLSAIAVSARIAYHEGRRAQLAGRDAEAVRCWRATVALGQSTQSCADLISEFRLGADLEGVGAGPAWRWLPDSLTGARGGGIQQGRFFYGPQHSFYLSRAGRQGEQRLRDAVVKTKGRTMMLDIYTSAASESQFYTRSGELLSFGQLVAGLLLAAILAMAVASRRWRRSRPVAPVPRSPWRLLSSLPGLLVLAVAAGIAVAFSQECYASPLRVLRGQDVLLGVALSAAAAMAGPIIPAILARRRGLPIAGAWLDSLEAGLAVLVVVAALVYSGLGLGAMQLRARWVHQKTHPVSEMERARRAMGPRWDSPPIRPNSWVEDHPPLP